jgi:gamma-glutamylputrescine oxidase
VNWNCISSCVATVPKRPPRSGDAPLRGIERIVAGIQRHNVQCGLLKQDSLFLGLEKGGKEAVQSELECRQEVGFTDQRTYDEQQLKGILGAEGYTAGIRRTSATSPCRAVSAR